MRLLVLPVLLGLAAAILLLVASGDDAGGVSTTTGARSRAPAASPRPTFQGKTAAWWARRAVQARKDANARGRTIRRLQAAQRRASAHFFDWLAAADCVHNEEARWDYNGGTYDGGMQADHSFQRTYGREHWNRWGEAWRWPWWAQLEMAYRGWLFRGWDPWPNTARECGLR